MSRKDRQPLAKRVARAGEAALASQNFVSPIEVLLGIGWIDPGTVRRWQQGQIDCLERAIQSSPQRLLEALSILRAWATEKGLHASQASYVARTPQRQALRFTLSGSASIEEQYRTHWISSKLSEQQRERIEERANRAPDLVVIQPLNTEWRCHRCGDTGDLLVMENSGPACLRCVGLDDLEYLPAGDALLTRRRREASDPPSSCDSAEVATAMSERGCWSSRRY
jgi:hypothetical protein